MDRLVVVWCPTLLEEGERGEEVRAFAAVLATVERFCPWVEPVRLGVCSLPARGPSRLFGGERSVAGILAGAVAEALGAGADPGVGVADGLFAATLAARSQVVVPPGGAAEFLAPWSVAVLRRPELAVTLQRLGVHTLGQFAALPARHVLARFGRDEVACHRVARGEEGELSGLRDPGVHRRLRVVAGDDEAVTDVVRQPGFFGGTSEADTRAARSFARVQQRLGPEAVQVGWLRGGRGPAERACLVPWGSRDGTLGRGPAGRGGPRSAPWPGRLPSPSPVTVLSSPVPAEMADGLGRPVEVSGRGLLADRPVRVSVGGGPWQDVVAWAGPWPVTERWWSGRRRRAHLQVVTVAGVAALLTAERGRWWLEAVYD
jgi:hypothetical protein